jgi:hypothetical protein
MSIIPGFRKLRKEKHEFEASLGYIVKFCLKKPRKQETKNNTGLLPRNSKCLLKENRELLSG